MNLLKALIIEGLKLLSGHPSSMHITQHTDYALRVLIYLASNEQRLVTIQEISERFEISRSHLMKVVNQLIRNGLWKACAARVAACAWRGRRSRLRWGCGAEDGDRSGPGGVLPRDEPLLPAHRHLSAQGVLGAALEAFFASLDKVALSEVLGPSPAGLLHVLKRAP
jgi:Rrf2 family nitric oxide-sensitive transcriptional repressor